MFTSEESGFLTEIDVGIRSAPVALQILIYDSFINNTPGNLVGSKDVIVESTGWHSEKIDSIEVLSDSDFFVCIKINEPYAISYDNNGDLSGRSFFSGNGINFSDNISNYGDINIRSKITYINELQSINTTVGPNDYKLHFAYPNPLIRKPLWDMICPWMV